MSKIKIKNVGPIKDGYQENDGFMDMKKVTVLIGDQGSGKSTVAKVFSTMAWIEKAINRGDLKILGLTKSDFFDFFEYQRIHNYLEDDSEIEYIGEKLSITYNKNLAHPKVVWNEGNYNVPKIMYVPAERNFLSVSKQAYGLTNLPGALYTFAEELRKGQIALNGKIIDLPAGDIRVKYKKENETTYLVGKNFELDLTESSSGYQSLVPLYLVSRFLSDELQKEKKSLKDQLSVEQSVRRTNEINKILYDGNLSPDEKEGEYKKIEARYLNTCFINIVEEPEQNLFPTSQRKMLNCLLEFNNKNEGNKLIITTHSPYLINYLTLAVKANSLIDKSADYTEESDFKITLSKIVPFNSTVRTNDLLIYELDDKGNIFKLGNYKGIPSDDNYLNNQMGEGNELFGKLLDLEELCQ